MPDIFDPKFGLTSDTTESIRDIKADLEKAEKIIGSLKEPIFVEDLIKLVQESCSLTNNEVYNLIKKVDSELNPKKDEPAMTSVEP